MPYCISPNFRGTCHRTGWPRWETKVAAKQYARLLEKERGRKFRAKTCRYCLDWHATAYTANPEVPTC